MRWHAWATMSRPLSRTAGGRAAVLPCCFTVPQRTPPHFLCMSTGWHRCATIRGHTLSRVRTLPPLHTYTCTCTYTYTRTRTCTCTHTYARAPSTHTPAYMLNPYPGAARSRHPLPLGCAHFPLSSQRQPRAGRCLSVPRGGQGRTHHHAGQRTRVQARGSGGLRRKDRHLPVHAGGTRGCRQQGAAGA